MDGKAVKKVQFIRYEEGEANERRQQRLKDDLGLNNEAVELIMNLREQITTLQARLRALEATLEIAQAGDGARLARYRQVVQEAVWEEMRE